MTDALTPQGAQPTTRTGRLLAADPTWHSEACDFFNLATDGTTCTCDAPAEIAQVEAEARASTDAEDRADNPQGETVPVPATPTDALTPQGALAPVLHNLRLGCLEVDCDASAHLTDATILANEARASTDAEVRPALIDALVYLGMNSEKAKRWANGIIKRVPAYSASAQEQIAAEIDLPTLAEAIRLWYVETGRNPVTGNWDQPQAGWLIAKYRALLADR